MVVKAASKRPMPAVSSALARDPPMHARRMTCQLRSSGRRLASLSRATRVRLDAIQPRRPPEAVRRRALRACAPAATADRSVS